MRFTKYEGLGNDICIFDFPEERLKITGRPLATIIRRLARRNHGIGADEIAFVSPPRGAQRRGGGAVARVSFFNSDGSKAEMCGNGMRCVALRLFDRRRTGGKTEFLVETDAGSRLCRVVRPATPRAAALVEVEMGRARRLDGAAGNPETVVLPAREGRLRPAAVSMGNPHAVFFGRFSRERMERLGEALQRHNRFPRGVNVGFARLAGREAIDLVVYERGCGFTLACGSGACAAAAAAAAKGLVPYDRPVKVHLPGGTLRITIERSDGVILMSGPARQVFEGSFDLEAFL
ncbi:MAG: diaminopimelate epimerase [Planctomycetota bacterium]